MTKQASGKAVPKFKKGDKAVYVGKDQKSFIGKEVTIESVIYLNLDQLIAYHLVELPRGVAEKILIEPEIYNSPLYQALK